MENMDSSIDPMKSEALEEIKVIKKPSIWQVSLLYSISIIMLIVFGIKSQHADLKWGLIITEFVLVLVPPLILVLITRLNFKEVLRLNKIDFKILVNIFFLMLFAIPVAGLFNGINYLIIKFFFGKIEVPDIPISSSVSGLMLDLFIIAVSAGICEEVLFRGVILRGFERFGAARAITITAILFGLMHLDFQRLVGTAVLGGLIGFIVYRTNSLYGGMFAHFTNNATAVLLSFLAIKLGQLQKSIGGAQKVEPFDFNNLNIANMSSEKLIGLIVGAVIMLIFLVGMVGIFIILLKTFIKNTKGNAENVTRGENLKGIAGMWLLAPGIILTSLIYAIEGARLLNVKLEFLQYIKDFIK